MKIKEEIIKQLKAEIVDMADYWKWLANIVMVPKKDWHENLYWLKRCKQGEPQGRFSVPYIDILVNNITSHALLIVMVGLSGYNKFQMAPEDWEKTSFITLWGTFC